METNKTLLDILFTDRNKEYGAYELRVNYSSRINQALLSTLTVVGILTSVLVFGKEEEFKKPSFTTTEVTITEIEEVKPPPPPPQETTTTETKVVKFTEPVIVTETAEPPPAQIDLRGAEIGTFNRDGDTCMVAPLPNIDGGTGIIDMPNEPEVFERVEIEAEFPGGVAKWRQYLERNLRASEEAPEGTYTVAVLFIVDREGNISDVSALTNHGYRMEEEAIRVIKRGPKWNPAVQNGRQVKAYRKQLITFQIGEQ